MPTPLCLVYATAPDQAMAERIATALLDQRLIACANILPAMTALYRWEGKVARANEVVLILKTRRSLADQAIAAAKALHPYTTPAFVILPVDGGHLPFLDWLRDETA